MRTPKPPELHVRRHYVSMPPDVDDALTRAMAEQGRNRSQIVAAALRVYLDAYVEEA